MFESLNQKQKIIFIIIILCMIAVIVYYIYTVLSNSNAEDTFSEIDNTILFNSDSENNMAEDISDKPEEILVHISGCVKEEKVVTLKSGSRIQDAINSAGGLSKDADLTNINLAYILEDGEKIYIPKKGEELSQDSLIYSESSVGTDASVRSSSTHTSSSNKTTKININKAGQSELETIPGVGPSTALKIVNYREENGKFKSIEDIKNVSGIGDAKYEQMKEYITVK